jgi:hypothetical protein
MLKNIIRKIKYPKLILLIVSIFFGYLIYKDQNGFNFHAIIQKLGYIGTFLSGLIFVYGFTTAPAIAMLLVQSSFQNFWAAGIIATIGVLLGNLAIFKVLKFSLENELDDLAKNRYFCWFLDKIKGHIPLFVRAYIFPALAGFISATPLPDEFAVALVSKSKDISITVFSLFAFTFSTFGIFIILLIGKMIS